MLRLILVILISLSALHPSAIAQTRLFTDLSLEYVSNYELTTKTFNETTIGGFSGITYNPQQEEYYLISDDRSRINPARFYTAKINYDDKGIKAVKIIGVHYLKNQQGQLYNNNTIDAEAIAYSPRNTLFISSEGVSNKGIPPFINEYDLNGNFLSAVPIPQRYIYDKKENKGIQDNYGFESLTIKANGISKEDPFRLFTSTELALSQDFDPKNINSLLRSRMMHYVVNPFGTPVLIAEHLYPVDKPPLGVVVNGISELLALPQEGYLLSLERNLGLRGFGAKIYQIVMANASDISNEKSLAGNIDRINPVSKKLVFDLQNLNIELDNLEGMTLGKPLADGSQSLILVSDNNFTPNRQKNQFILLKMSYN